MQCHVINGLPADLRANTHPASYATLEALYFLVGLERFIQSGSTRVEMAEEQFKIITVNNI